MLGLAILVIVGLAVVAARNPLVRRVGLRNARRRPREAALVMLGCSLGTALIVGSAAVGTSYTASLRHQALGELGPLDALISYDNATNWAAANARLNARHDADFAFTGAAALLRAPVTSNHSDDTAPRAFVLEADYQRVAPMMHASEPAAGPTAGTAWASPSLAEQLNLAVGTAVTIHANGALQLRVARVTDSALARFVESTLNRGDNLLVPPGTIAKLEAAAGRNLGAHRLTLIGLHGAHGETPPTPEATDALQRKLDDLAAPYDGRAVTVRADRLDSAVDAGKSSAAFLTVIGAFGILSGALLLVNVLLMLAEERLAELGTMRAVGLSRRPLIQAFTLEGAIYAVFGSLLGGVGGVLLGRLMVGIAAQSRSEARVPFDLRFDIPLSVFLGRVAAGFLLSIVVVAATSFRVSRLDVIRSIRGLPDPPRRRHRMATPIIVVLVAVGFALGAFGLSTRASLALIVGPMMATTGIGVLVSGRWGRVAGITTACVPNVVWSVVYQMVNRDSDVAPTATVFGGVLLVLSGVLLVNAHQATVAQLVRRIGRGRATVTSRLGLANPVAHRVRTLLTVGPFALVVFTLAYAEGLAHLINTELNKIAPHIAGSYNVYAESSPLHPFDFSTLHDPGVTHVARTATMLGSFSGAGSDQRFWSLTAFAKDFDAVTPPVLASRDGTYRSDRAAYEAVRHDPDLIIVPGNFLFGGTPGRSRGEPARGPVVGDVYVMYNVATGAARDVTVVGVGQTDVMGNGAYYGYAHARGFFGDSAVRNSAFITTKGSPRELATALNRAGVDNGMEAVVPATVAKESFALATNVVNLYRSDLGVGIVVGIAGVAVVLVRSVRDRRQQIGTLRAMGFEAKQIGSSFLLEGLFVAMQGVGVGIALGTVTTMALARSPGIKEILGYTPPIPSPPVDLVLLTVFLIGTSLAASYGPAKSAARIPPSVALRLVD